MEKVLAIITARGGSKRIPKKNIKDFFGRPMISYAINTALKSGLFDRVMVSTDCDEIAEVAKKYGAEVPFIRSRENSDDHASTADVLVEVLDDYKKIGYSPKYTCCIYPATPFITIENYIDAKNKIMDKDLDSIITVTKYPAPIEWALRKKGCNIIANNQDMLNIRSQDIEEKFYDAGQFYFLNTERFLLSRSIFTSNSGWIQLDSSCCQDVDDMEDWNNMELKWKIKYGK